MEIGCHLPARRPRASGTAVPSLCREAEARGFPRDDPSEMPQSLVARDIRPAVDAA